MSIPSDNLRLVLIFVDQLRQVAVQAITNHHGFKLRNMGVVEGKEQLVDFLDRTAIDHYIVFSDNFGATAFEYTPKQIADGLEKAFQRVGGSSAASISLTVCSSSLKSNEGLEHTQAWFTAEEV